METLTNIHNGEETAVKLIDMINPDSKDFQPIVFDFYNDFRTFFKFKLNELGFDCVDVNEFYADTNVLRLFEFDIPQLNMSVPDELDKKFKHRFIVELVEFAPDIFQLYLWDKHYLEKSPKWILYLRIIDSSNYSEFYKNIESRIEELLDSTKKMLPYNDIITHINSAILNSIHSIHDLYEGGMANSYEAFPILRLADYREVQLLSIYMQDYSYRFSVEYRIAEDNDDIIEYVITRKIGNMSAEPKILSANLNELVENIEGCELDMFTDAILANLK